MVKLVILGEGEDTKKRDNDKGKLFEELSKQILETIGYRTTHVTRVNYAGMEIDIEGYRIPERKCFIGECKCWNTPIDAKSLQAFYGKYVAKRNKDEKIVGIFLAIPYVNGPARGYYNDYIKDQQITFSLIEEKEFLGYIYTSKKVISEDELNIVISKNIEYILGDTELLYTRRGFFYLKYLIKKSESLSSEILITDSTGAIIKDIDTVKYIEELNPSIKTYKMHAQATDGAKYILEENQEIVLVKGNSSTFEYQFPASPKYFFGRKTKIDECRNYISDIKNNKSSAKGLVILANSGWGKSSLVLKLTEIVLSEGILIIPIDSRTAVNEKFCFKAVDYAIKEALKKKLLQGNTEEYQIGGYSSLLQILKKASSELTTNNKMIMIFFDQFENIFFKADILQSINNMLSLMDETTKNILLGFSWKSDLLSIAEQFPFEIRNSITNQCIKVILPTFDDNEITIMLKELKKEIKNKINLKLEQQIREYSQGYPWLFKKLCAHIIKQIKKGIKQSDLINSMLNIKELFDQDLAELHSDEKEMLVNIAKRAPILASEMPESCTTEILRSLIDKRLLVQIGQIENRFDIYWDIFKDYLNTGNLPIEDSYILRISPGSILKALFKIKKNKCIDIDKAHLILGFKGMNAVYNVIKELRLLDLIRLEDKTIVLQLNSGVDKEEFDLMVKVHLRNKLKRHKIALKLLDQLNINKQITLEQFSKLLEKEYPYIKADNRTWIQYAKNFSTWFDCSNLIVYDIKKVLRVYDSSSEIRTKSMLLERIQKTRRRAIFFIPSIQYGPIAQAIVAIGDAIKSGQGKIETIFTRSTWRKSLKDAEDLKFIVIESNKIKLLIDGIRFYQEPLKRADIFTKAVSELKIYKVFSEIYQKGAGNLKVKELAEKLNIELEANWTKQTSLTVTKILINWSKITGLHNNQNQQF